MADIDDTLADALGDLLVGAGPDSFIRLPAGVPSYVLIVDPSSPHQLVWVSTNQLLSAVLAHKGSIAVASSPTQVREFRVGDDGDILMADSNELMGVKWVPSSLFLPDFMFDFSHSRNSFYLGVM